MTARNKQRGNELEREVVKLCEKYGLEAKRAYASNGQSLGLSEKVDILIDTMVGSMVTAQCKRMKHLPKGFLTNLIESGVVNVNIFREDKDKKNPAKLQGKPYVLMPLESLIILYAHIGSLNEFADRLSSENVKLRNK